MSPRTGMKPSGSKVKYRGGIEPISTKAQDNNRKEAAKGAVPKGLSGGGITAAGSKAVHNEGKDALGGLGRLSRTLMKRSGTTEKRLGDMDLARSKNSVVCIDGSARDKRLAAPHANSDVIVLSSDSEHGSGKTIEGDSDNSTRTQTYYGRLATEVFGRKYIVANVIEFELWYPYKAYMELLEVDDDWGNTRWIDIKTSGGRVYKVKLVKKSNYYTLTEGWTLLAVCERLKAGLKVRFHYHGTHINFDIISQAKDKRKRGFADAIAPGCQVSRSSRGVYRGNGCIVPEQIGKAISTLRAAANTRHRIMYICTINKSQKNEMYFSTEFSDMLPLKKETVALRFVGSPVVVSAAVRRYGKACTKIMNGWKEFVGEHQINQGDVLAFQCYQGTNVFEMMICRV